LPAFINKGDDHSFVHAFDEACTVFKTVQVCLR
jgi:hypothetical protein